MNRNEAVKVAKEMQRVGFNTNQRHYNDGSYAVEAIDSTTGVSITIHTVKQWQERKAAAEFDAKYS